MLLMKIRNKIILIVLFFTLFLLFANKVNAFDFTYNNVDYSIDLPEEPNGRDYVIYISIYGSITRLNVIYLNDDTTLFGLSLGSDPVPAFYSRPQKSWTYYRTQLSSVKWEYSPGDLTFGNNCFDYNDFESFVSCVNERILLSTVDIALLSVWSGNSLYSYEGELVFQVPPQVQEVLTLEEVTTQAHLQAKEITTESLEKELEELVPVGVIILATLILVSLVAYFSFWRT